MIDFITTRKGLSIFTLNCQSLNAHAADLTDEVTQQSTILVLSETWVQNEETMDVPNFDCVVKFKRPDVRTDGIAIYHNSTDRATVVIAHMDVTFSQNSSLVVNTTVVGEICAARCTVESGQTILVVAVYISPNKKIYDIIDFIHELLVLYTSEGAALFKKNWDEIPMIMSGDFNVNFAKPEAQPLIDFLDNNLKLKMNKTISTAKSGTTIDAVFCRYLEKLTSRTYVSYFSYHKPIVTFLEFSEDMDTSE